MDDDAVFGPLFKLSSVKQMRGHLDYIEAFAAPKTIIMLPHVDDLYPNPRFQSPFA